MEGDFPMSPSKRRRTDSPESAQAAVPTQDASPITSIPRLGLTEEPTIDPTSKGVMDATDSHPTTKETHLSEPDSGPDLLNMLMAQVAAQAGGSHSAEDSESPVMAHTRSNVQEDVELPDASDANDSKEEGRAPPEITPSAHAEKQTGQSEKHIQEEVPGTSSTAVENSVLVKENTEVNHDDVQQATTPLDAEQLVRDEHQQYPARSDPLPATGMDVSSPEDREWESDSSPYSSSTDSSDDSSDEDDSDNEADNDYALLSPTEQARILMDDVGSDDEGGKSKGPGGQLKTANEKVEDVIPKPNIVVTPEMTIVELGNVEAVVESTVLIKGKTTGEYQVLESGSLLCRQDREVVGVVADTMGRVEQPLYTIRFTNDDAIADAGLSEKGTVIYYVHQYSTFVFTQPLKGLKGSDASNFHDEEVGDEEMEFSDDEKEAEHRRLLKMRKRGIDPDASTMRGGGGGGRGRGRGGGDRGRGRGGFQPALPSHPENAMVDSGEAMSLNYDDGEVGEYEPLRRPNIMENQGSAVGPAFSTARPAEAQRLDYRQNEGRRGNHQRGRGRGQNYRGRGNRGNFPQNQNTFQHQPSNFHPQRQQPGHNFDQQAQQPTWLPPVPPPPGMPNSSNLSMAGGINPFNFNFPPPPAMLGQGYSQQWGYVQQQNSWHGNSWGNNQAAMQQVAQHLEQMRAQGQDGGQNGSGTH